MSGPGRGDTYDQWSGAGDVLRGSRSRTALPMFLRGRGGCVWCDRCLLPSDHRMEVGHGDDHQAGSGRGCAGDLDPQAGGAK